MEVVVPFARQKTRCGFKDTENTFTYSGFRFFHYGKKSTRYVVTAKAPLKNKSLTMKN